MGEEGAHVVGAETGRMGGVVEADVAHDPLDVGLFGVIAVLATPTGPAHAVEERGGRRGWRRACRNRGRESQGAQN